VANPIDRVHLDPQVVHNQILVEHERPWLGNVREPRPPARYSATPTALGRHAPKLDEHTDEVLAELGRTPEQIADLRTRGIIGLRR
jgi:formyl-CoA transferase